MALGVRDGNFNGLALQTRSVAEILHNVAASIEVPAEHVKEGLVQARSDPPGDPGTARSCTSFRAKARRGRPTSPCSIAAGGTMWTTRT